MTGALVGALLAGEREDGQLQVEHAAATIPTCYGDYCSGQYADDTGCDKDARTISSTILSKTSGSLEIALGPLALSTGNDNGELGILELRRSDACGTSWARLKTKEASDITYLGVEKDDGYQQQVSINGGVPGSPATNVFTPMVYGRGDSEFRAYVFSQEVYDPTPDNTGTYWTTG